jgi:DegV family protein with EDD domain
VSDSVLDPPTVVVVTDSTSYLPPTLATELGIRVVPLHVTIGNRSGMDGIEVSSADVTNALRAHVPVTTSRPSPAEFAVVYQAALDAGASNVVSVHVSATLSGTWDSARLAAQDFGYGTVRVVDSRSAGMALGFAVLAAARAAAAGSAPADVQDAAVSTVDRTRALFYVDTLEYLRRGGRIGSAAALLGTSLSVKPLLHVNDGRIVLLEKVRTSSKALARLLQLTLEGTLAGKVDVAVQHLDAPDRAAELAEQITAAVPSMGELYVSEVGAVVGAHLGPGVIGTVVVARA